MSSSNNGPRFNSQLLLFIVLAILLAAGYLLRPQLDSAATVSQGEFGESLTSGATVASGTSSDNVADGTVSANATEVAPLAATTGGDLAQVPVIDEVILVPELDPVMRIGQRPVHSFETYVVERGDAPQNIADRFNISPETLLGGNPALSNEASLLQTGVELIILPQDGVLHSVQLGDTIESVSELYGILVDEIVAYPNNNLEFPYRLYPETEIFVPGAQPAAAFVWNPPTLASVVGSSPEALDLPVFVTGSGFHVWPVTVRRITQGHWVGHQAIDIGLPEGGAVIATDRGTVTYAAWSPYCYGNLVVINHGATGHETFYAHLSSIGVVPGQIVEQGQFIGRSGNTGCSSGPHLHYEIRIFQNRDNPLFYLP